MQKKYITARLFKKNRMADDPDFWGELEQEKTEEPEVVETAPDNKDPAGPDNTLKSPPAFLPPTLLNILQKTSDLLGLNLKK